MLDVTGKSRDLFCLIPCFWLVSCVDAIASPSTFEMARLSNGTLLCCLDLPSVQIPLRQLQLQQLSASSSSSSSSAGTQCVPATVGCALQCKWDARCTSFNVREDMNNRCDLFYNRSTTCGVISGCSHGQLNRSNCNMAECLAGFVYAPNVSRCYRLLNETLSHDEAERRCGSLGPTTRLVTIANATQQSAVKAYLDSVLNPPATSVCVASNTVWTSGVDYSALFSPSPSYRWHPGPGVYDSMDYKNYYEGEPNSGAQGPYCVALWQRRNSQWNDEVCALPNCALCEYTP